MLINFLGNAPSADASVFTGDPAFVYYLPGTTGWASMFAGLAAFAESPAYSLIFTNNAITLSAYLGGGGAVTIPSSLYGFPVTAVSSRAFYDCAGLTSVTIPNGVTNLGTNTFSLCTGLTNATIPGSVTSIGSEAFYGCWNLANVTISPGVTSIGLAAFYGCSSLTSVAIPNTVTDLEPNTFEFSGLTKVTIPGSVASIGSEAFYECENLASATILPGVTCIGREHSTSAGA
jgi:hypothetical protein